MSLDQMRDAFIFEEKKSTDQHSLILNSDQKANDPDQDRNRSIGPL